MKKQLLFFLFISLSWNQLFAQEYRYQQAIFPQVDKQSNISYGDADRYDVFGLNNPQPLLLDFYEPANDTANARPLMLVFFGGAFLIGDKIMQDMVAWCDSLATYGYACAAVNYRIGYNVASLRSSVRAGYRALQDVRAAVRFFKANAANYKIDTNYIFLAGNSAGAISSIQAAYGDDSNRPPETFSGSSFDEGSDLGCTDCSGNNYTNSAKVAGIISCWGAGVDKSALDTNDTAPILHFHGDADNIVPIDSGAAFNAPVFPTLYGSRTIHNIRIAQGMPSELHVYEGQGHNFYYNVAIFPSQYWDSIWTISHAFLCDILPYCERNTAISKIENQPFFDIAPNPVEEQLTIQFHANVIAEEKTIGLYNLQGKNILTRKTHQEQEKFDMTTLPKGIYLLQIQSNQFITTQKIVKQ